MEKEVKIKIPKSKKYIYGIQRGLLSKPLVIFVHGLTGYMNEHQFFNGARFFEKSGFSSFRFNLYGWQENARDLIKSTLRTHASDLDTVIRYYRRQGVKKIFVVGHSYGGATILFSKEKDFDGVVLWDSSHPDCWVFEKRINYVKALKAYRGHWDFDVLIGKKMYDESKNWDWTGLIKSITAPIKIIVASKSGLLQAGKKYYREANEPKSLKVIEGATHCFDEDGVEEKLFRETLKWFKKYQ